MAWTAKLIKKIGTGDDPDLWTIRYTEGITGKTNRETFEASPTLTLDWVKTRAAARIEYLTARDAATGTLVEGTVTPAVIVPPEEPPQYVKKLAKYRATKRAMDLGILPAGSGDSLLAWLIANYDPAYLDFI